MRFRSFLLLFPFVFLCFIAFNFHRTAAEPFASTVSITGRPEGAEGFFGNTAFTFTLTRTGDLIGQCRVIYETREGTAFTPEDFEPTTGTATFAAGQTTVQVPVLVRGERFSEIDETFSLALISAAGDCTLGTATGIATILDDDGGIPPGFCPGGIEGDIGFDAALRVDDLIRIRRFALGIDTPASSCIFQKADLNADCGDGAINTADVTVLRQWILQGNVQRPNCGPQFPF